MEFLQNVLRDIKADGWVVIFALAGVVLNALAYQQRTKRGILMTVVAAMSTVSIYYFLKGTVAGGIMNILSIVRSLAFDRKDAGVKWLNSKWVLFGFMAFFVGAGIYSGIANDEGAWAFLSVSGMAFATIAMWVKNPGAVRLLSLPGMVSWLIYNAHNSLWILNVSDIICIISILVGIMRYDILGKEENAKKIRV